MRYIGTMSIIFSILQLFKLLVNKFLQQISDLLPHLWAGGFEAQHQGRLVVRGSHQASALRVQEPHPVLVSYQTYRQLSGWNHSPPASHAIVAH